MLLRRRQAPAPPLAWRELIDHFKDLLNRATEKRPRRQDWVPGPDGHQEIEWVSHERAVMLAAVNAERALRGLEEVPARVVMKVESNACGHIDYVAKFALGCAEIVQDDSWALHEPTTSGAQTPESSAARCLAPPFWS